MTRLFHSVSPDEIAALFNDFAPERYHIDDELARINLFDSPLLDWGASQCSDRAFVAVKRPSSRFFRGSDPDQFHVSLLAASDPQSAIDLLAECKRTLRHRGASRLVFGQDLRHFFPGCPDDFPALRDFLIVEGFEAQGQSHDLERDLASYERSVVVPEKFEIRQAVPTDRAPIEKFLSREFPGRWKHDVLEKFDVDGPKCLYLATIGRDIEGFSLVQDWTTRLPIGGAVWRKDLGEHWGSLGPIGVAAKQRGKGAGDALLVTALTGLRDQGIRRCIIDWTGIEGFYKRHGFEITRTYRSMVLEFSS